MHQFREYPKIVESNADIGPVGDSLGESALLDDKHSIIPMFEGLIE